MNERRVDSDTQCAMLIIVDLCIKRGLKNNFLGYIAKYLLGLVVKATCQKEDRQLKSLPICLERRNIVCSEEVLKRLESFFRG